MQINRLFEIIYLLMDKKSMTAAELAAHFEVSKRTILRDIDTLSAAGIPVYTTQGKGGGISILDHYVLSKAVLSEEEQNQILFALQGLSATQSISTESILGKLQGLFAKTDANWIEVDFSRWGKSAEDQAKFELLKNAIMQKNALAFQYSSSYGQTSDRRVYPLKLVFKAKSWYLQAFCLPKENYRTFKINRMQALTPLEESFAERTFQIPDMDAYDTPCPSLIKATLLFAPHMAYRVYDEFSDDHVTVHEDGSLLVTVKLPSDEWLPNYLLSFGTSVEVIEPQSVRDAMVQLAESVREVYS